MIIVTGGAGMIGANLVKALNDQGRTDILVVDNLRNGRKFVNLTDCDFQDYLDKDDFAERIRTGEDFGYVEALFHLGACSVTTEWDGRYMMANNFEYSKTLLHWCDQHQIPFIYASSAATYGDTRVFREERQHEGPLNVYGFSKWQFDQYLRAHWHSLTTQVVGLRYFNVYGPREQHKGAMASVAWHIHQQLLAGENPKLFGAHEGFAAGEQKRDFIYVGDVAEVNLWFLRHPATSGIFNLGTGRGQTFNEVAEAVIAHHGRGHIEYIPFPDHLKGVYQSYTQADMSKLRQAGCEHDFMPIEAGLAKYFQWLERNHEDIAAHPAQV